ncbi:MAG: fibronectin type III domain-containing protein [Bacteroidetes bacterium]|nr:fibronectin type III domain-containing protein [Bacteroidota bacterium]
MIKFGILPNEGKLFMKLRSKIFFLISAALSFSMFGCVDSIIDNTAGSPSINISSPLSNGRVVVGENNISYEAADHANGQGLSHFDIYIYDTFLSTTAMNDDGTLPTLTMILSEALIDSRISYYVIVYNKDGQSKKSTVQDNILVLENIPEAPSDIIITLLTEHSVNLLWTDNSDNETNFELWRKVSSSGTYGENPYRILPMNTISTDDIGLSPTIEYYYKVRAINETGASAFSAEASTSGTSSTLWNLKAYAIGSSAVHLTWTDFYPNELGFLLERVNPLSGTWERVDPLPLRNTTEYIDTDVTANTTYTYRITYYTNTTVGPWSNKAIITTYYTDDAPPKNFMVLPSTIQISASAVPFVTWEDNSNLENGTQVEYRFGSEGRYELFGTYVEDYDHTAKIYFTPTGGLRVGTYYLRARHILAENVYTHYTNEVILTVIP